MKNTIWILAITSIIMNILDALTTIIGLNIGKKEMNPAFHLLIILFGINLAILIKIFIIMLIVLIIETAARKKFIPRTAAIIFLIFIIISFSRLWINNLCILFNV